MEFPRRIYTVTEVMKARECVENGYLHRIRIVGSKDFKERIKKIKSLLRITGYYDFVRTFIRLLKEIDGIGQLREAEATIWLNSYIVENLVEGARFIVQKAHQMSDYLEGKQYYEKGELAAIEKSIDFLRALKGKRVCEELKLECKEVLEQWTKERVL